jgi:predicted metal-dependent hydrolase
MKQEIQYKEKIIPYELIKSPIKNMYIYVREGRVTVKVPYRLKDKEIQEFISKKSKWIYDKLKQEPKIVEKMIEPEEVERLEEIVRTKIEKYAILLKVMPNKVRIKDIKYAWGSCSSNRNITISKKLAKKEEKVIEYVVLHEMCHLKYMNHSKEFWNLIESYLPEYKTYRALLN